MNCLSVDKSKPPQRALWLAIIHEAKECAGAYVKRVALEDGDAEMAEIEAAIDLGIVLGHCEAHYERHGIHLCAHDLLEDARRMVDATANPN